MSDYLKLRGAEVLHPQIGIVDFDKVNPQGYIRSDKDGFHFNCYAIFLKDSEGCKLRYGGKSYDYDEGTLVFIGPNQIVEFGDYPEDYVPKGYALLFHSDLLHGTELGRKLKAFTYFRYSLNEALHISTKERKVFLSILDKLQFELEQNMDKHSKTLLLSNLELLLNYCQRFYDRQFFTREHQHQNSLQRFDELLHDYLNSDLPQCHGMPSVSYFAEQLHLSKNYFGDLVKKESGYSAQDYIQTKLIEVAKEKVFDPNKSVSQIAYELGFKYPQHFSRLFKKKVGHSPMEFRSLN